MRAAAIWIGVTAFAAWPVIVAAQSPLLAWREPIYIIGGFAGIMGMALMLFQPLLVLGFLPGLPTPQGRQLHRWVGAGIVFAVVVHVAGLWITSPPDVIDVLLFRSPTPFGVWGAIAMWAVFASAALAIWRVRSRPPLRLWRRAHSAAAVAVVVGTVLHALLIEGTMETLSKVVLVVLLGAATIKALIDLRPWTLKRSKSASDRST